MEGTDMEYDIMFPELIAYYDGLLVCFQFYNSSSSSLLIIDLGCMDIGQFWEDVSCTPTFAFVTRSCEFFFSNN